MPFTVSHVAAVLPLVGRRRGPALPVAGLVAGSMAPDYPWFLSGGRTAGFSHSLPGLLTVDLVVGLVGVLLWRRVVAAPVRDLLPLRMGRHVPPPAATGARHLPLLALAVVAGAVTHVVWDGFTHPGRFGVRWISWLGSDHAGVPGHQWAQLASGVVGGLVLVGWLVVRVRSAPLPARGTRDSVASIEERLGALLLVLLTLLAGAVVGLVTSPPDLESMLFRVVTRGGLGMGLGVLAVCVGWHARHPAGLGAKVADG